MQLVKDDRISKRLLREVSRLLEEYPIEEVQAAINSLVADTEWLKKHREDELFVERRFDVV